MKEGVVMIVFAKNIWPAPSVWIGKVQVDDLMPCHLEDAWVFILFAQVEVVDDHFHIRVVHLADHLQCLGASVQDVALLSSQRLNGNQDIGSARNVTCYFQEFCDL